MKHRALAVWLLSACVVAMLPRAGLAQVLPEIKNLARLDVAGDSDLSMIAVLDTERVFKECAEFQQAKARLETEVAAAKHQLNVLEQPRRCGIGPPHIAEADFRVMIHMPCEQRQEFAECKNQEARQQLQASLKQLEADEGELYAKTYRQLRDVVRDHCQESRIELVLRKSDAPPPIPRHRLERCFALYPSTERQVVVWKHGKSVRDITDDVIHRMNNSEPATAAKDFEKSHD